MLELNFFFKDCRLTVIKLKQQRAHINNGCVRSNPEELRDSINSFPFIKYGAVHLMLKETEQEVHYFSIRRMWPVLIMAATYSLSLSYEPFWYTVRHQPLCCVCEVLCSLSLLSLQKVKACRTQNESYK